MNTKTALTTSKWKKERIRETNRDMETEQRAKGREKKSRKETKKSRVKLLFAKCCRHVKKHLATTGTFIIWNSKTILNMSGRVCVYERDKEIREEATKEIAHIKWLNNYGFCFVFCFSFNLCCTTEIPIPRKWTEKTQTKTRKNINSDAKVAYYSPRRRYYFSWQSNAIKWP